MTNLDLDTLNHVTGGTAQRVPDIHDSLDRLRPSGTPGTIYDPFGPSTGSPGPFNPFGPTIGGTGPTIYNPIREPSAL